MKVSEIDLGIYTIKHHAGRLHPAHVNSRSGGQTT
jgi:hypothetical protein